MTKKLIPLIYLVSLALCFVLPCFAETLYSYLDYDWTQSAIISGVDYESGEDTLATLTPQGFRSWASSYGAQYSGYAVRASLPSEVESLTVKFSVFSMFDKLDYVGENGFRFYSYVYGVNSANRPSNYTAKLRFHYSNSEANWYTELGAIVNHIVDIGGSSSFDILFETWRNGVLALDREFLNDVTLEFMLTWDSDSLPVGTAYYISFAEQSYVYASDSWQTKEPNATVSPPGTVFPGLPNLTLPDFSQSISDDGKSLIRGIWALDIVVQIGIPIILLALFGVTAKIILYKR